MERNNKSLYSYIIETIETGALVYLSVRVSIFLYRIAPILIHVD